MNGGSNMFSKHCAIKPSAIKELMKTNNSLGMKLTTDQFTSATIPGTLRALFTGAWMREFFRLTGILCVISASCVSRALYNICIACGLQ